MNEKIICIVILIILVLILFFNLKKQESFNTTKQGTDRGTQDNAFIKAFIKEKQKMADKIEEWEKNGNELDFQSIVKNSSNYMLMYIMYFAIRGTQNGSLNSPDTFINDNFNKYLSFYNEYRQSSKDLS